MNCLFAGSFVLELATEIAVAIKMIDGTFTNCKQFELLEKKIVITLLQRI